jgi:glycosyltransferase involved in cell wall biosynthesis
MKTICIVADGHWDQLQGGAEYQLDLLARELARRGHQVHYLFTDRGTPLRESPVVLHPLQLSRWVRRLFHPYHALLWRQVFTRLDRIRPDVIVNRVGNALTGICALYGKRTGITTIWHVANITDLLPWRVPRDRTFAMTWIDRRLLDYGIRRVDRILAQAVYQDKLLMERFGRRADLIVPNFHPVPCAIADKSSSLDVIWVANIKPKKQPEQFVRLANELSDLENVRFIMIGRPAETA